MTLRCVPCVYQTFSVKNCCMALCCIMSGGCIRVFKSKTLLFNMYAMYAVYHELEYSL